MPHASTFYLAPATRSMFEAVRRGDVGWTRRLASEGADLFAADSKGMTAMRIAASRCDAPMIRLLLALGAKAEGGKTAPMPWSGRADVALHDAILGSGGDGGECIRLLLEAGAWVDRVNLSGEPSLVLAVKSGWLNRVQILIDAGADLHAKDAQGRDAALTAARRGLDAPLGALLRAGARVDQVDRDGFGSSLAMIAVGKEPECLARLIEHGASLDAVDRELRTATMIAAAQGRPVHLRMLVEAGADVMARDRQGLDALARARAVGNRECVEILEALTMAHGERSALAGIVVAGDGSRGAAPLRM